MLVSVASQAEAGAYVTSVLNVGDATLLSGFRNALSGAGAAAPAGLGVSKVTPFIQSITSAPTPAPPAPPAPRRRCLFRLSLLGERFSAAPPVFAHARARLRRYERTGALCRDE